MKTNSLHCKIYIHFLWMFFTVGISAGFSQAPVSIKWFPKVKTDKDQYTLMLLNASERGFHLLRWQNSRTDASGKQTPAMPILTILTPGGERLHDEPLPGFDTGIYDFRFATANDSILLVVYEAPNSAGTQTLFARKFNIPNRKWAAEAQVLFTNVSNRAPAFATAWFNQSANGNRRCIYHLTNGETPRLSMAMFDGQFNLLWQRTADLPAASRKIAMRQLLCTDNGEVLVHCQIYNPGKKIQGRPYATTPGVYTSSGQAFFQAPMWATEAMPYSDAIFLLSPDSGSFADFYPNLGKNFTPSFEISEGPDGKIYCAGFYSEEGENAVDGYFVYEIDLAKKQGEVLKLASLPSSLRRAYLSKNAAAKKEAIPGLTLRWLRWTSEGRPWILAERQNFDLNPGRMEEATLLRLDSTYRINATRKVEKYQRLAAGDPQNFASVATLPGSKNGWWLLWNQGTWPNAKIILTECSQRNNPVDYIIDNSSQSNVSLLPQTLLKSGDTWYFVGESEYHERICIGMLEKG